MQTAVTELETSRVKVEVSVSPDEMAPAVERAARELGAEIRVPGFRQGHAPSAVVIQRAGWAMVAEHAVREGLAGWYELAVREANIKPVGEPKVDLEALPERGAPLEFSIEVGVVPRAQLGAYRELEVGRRDPEVEASDIDREIDRMRDEAGRLEPVDRAVSEGDFVAIDFEGRVDGRPLERASARDHVVEVGSGQMVGSFESELVGMVSGDRKEFTIRFPDDYEQPEVAGSDVEFEVSAKTVQEKRLPEVDDEFASQSGFDTVAELRSDIEEKLRAFQQSTIEREFREAAVDAAVANGKVDIPSELVDARVQEMRGDFESSLKRRGIEPDVFMKISGTTEEQLDAQMRERAVIELKREAVLEAVADEESIEATDDDLVAEIEKTSDGGGKQVRRSLKRLKSSGRDAAVREQIRIRKALDIVVQSAKPIPMAQAKAREDLWTPDKAVEDAEDRIGEGAGGAAGASAAGLWTPGD